MQPDFVIDSSTAGRLVLSGEFDVLGASILFDELVPYGGSAVCIDLSGVTFVDSSGLKGLLKAKRDNPLVRVENPTPPVARLLELTGLLDVVVDGRAPIGD